MQRRALLTGIGATLAAGSAGCLSAVLGTTVTESFENSYDIAEGTPLVITNRNGPVTVEDTDGEQLVVSGEKEASSDSALDDISVDLTKGEQSTVDVTFSTDSEFESQRVDLAVEVPDGVPVQRAETANGDTTVRDVRGDIEATTSNGDVTVTDVDGVVRCETSNGDVQVRGATGVTEARTSNGLVDAELLSIDDDVTCASSNGTVTVRAGPDVACAYVLTTSNGSASVEDLQHTTVESDRGSLEGRLRGGTEPTLRLESTNGDVTLRAVESEE